MFSIIISEKGGAERREGFDKNEINVGRVQGNDLMLPKGNVSKHHARLLFRDGRFIVTDLKSTNGTYVNGRKIAQATIVREGDKIYIGDFVLRLEANEQASASPEAPPAQAQAPLQQPPPQQQQQPQRAQPAVTLKAPTHPPGAPMPRPQPQNVSHVQNASQAPAHTHTMGAPMGAPPPGTPPFAREAEPEAPPAQAKPRMGETPSPVGTPQPGAGGVRPGTMPLNQMSPGFMSARPSGQPAPQPATAAAMPVQIPAPMAAAPMPVAPMPAPTPQRLPDSGGMTQSPPSVPPPQRVSVPPARREGPKETPAQAGRRLAVTMLIGRIADAVDLAPLRATPQVPEMLAQLIERAAREQAKSMRDEGEAPQDIDLDDVAREAHRELVGLGAFGPLLEDEDVTEIHAVRSDQIFAMRGGVMTAEGNSFSSEEALVRIIGRLAAQSGDPWKSGEVVVERKLPRFSMLAVAPPLGPNHVVTIRKRLRVEANFEDFLRSNSLSRSMAQFLEACVAARANILVAGPAPIGFVAALAAAGGGGRVSVVQDSEEIAVGDGHAVALSMPDTRKLGEECVRAAVRMKPNRLVVAQLAGGVAAATLDAITEGMEGVVAGVSAPTLRQGLSRLVGQLVLYRPGLTPEAMREVVGEAFDVAVEVGTLADGRTRVMRIAELGGADAKGIVVRDVFTFTADASGGDGNFSAAGVAPRIANELAIRGMKLDPAMFKRGLR